MNTLGENTVKTVTREESYSLNFSYVSQAILPKGALVKLDPATGEVLAATAADAFGILTVGCKAIGEKVTVQTQFNAEVIGQADVAVTLGAKLCTTGIDATTKRTKYKIAVAGNTVVGTALSAGADTAEITVGVLRTFYTLPA